MERNGYIIEAHADLRDANLAGADLRYTNLRGACLVGADLEGADLEGAFLEGANLAGANLHRANLKRAFCSGANFMQATLIEANLHSAMLDRTDLRWARLCGARLEGADLEGAELAWAIFEDTQEAQGQVSEPEVLHGVTIVCSDDHEVEELDPVPTSAPPPQSRSTIWIYEDEVDPFDPVEELYVLQPVYPRERPRDYRPTYA